MCRAGTRSRASAGSSAIRCRRILDSAKNTPSFNRTDAGVRLAPLICFEDTIGELTRQFRFGGRESAGQCDQRRLVPAFRWFAAASGECSFSLRGNAPADGPRGQYRRDLFHQSIRARHADSARRHGSQFTEGVLTGEVQVPIDYQPTFYVRHGELFAQCCAVVTALVTGEPSTLGDSLGECYFMSWRTSRASYRPRVATESTATSKPLKVSTSK